MNWIKVSEKLPKSKVDVLAICMGNIRVMHYDIYADYWRESENGNPRSRVTHWMPLPSPPEE